MQVVFLPREIGGDTKVKVLKIKGKSAEWTHPPSFSRKRVERARETDR